MARNRVLYQSELLYVGPSGLFQCTGQLNITGNGQNGPIYGNILSATSGQNLVAELYRIQKVDHNWNKRLQDVNQFGELGRIDAVSIEPPTVGLSYSWLQNNLVNEKLIGLTVSSVGEPQVTCVSGILAALSDSKNYFLKIGAEGSDLIDSNPATYDVISFGNAYISSYTAQGSVGNFPTVDVAVDCLNAQAQTVTHAVGAITPAVFPSDGTSVTGWGYILPTGLTSFNNLGLTNNQGISVLRPGDINLTLGLSAGDGFAAESDMKIQSYNVSFSLNQEDLLKLGTKYAYAKVPTFPVQATMTVSALRGDIQTGSLIRIVDDNLTFNPLIKISKPGSPTTQIITYQLKGAKLDSQDFSSSIGSNSTINLTFNTQISSKEDTNNGLFISGVTSI